MKIDQRQSAPGRTQNRQPRYPIGRMQQRAGQRKQIPHDGAGAQRIDFDGAESFTGPAQSRDRSDQMAPGAHQDGDGSGPRPGVGRPCAADDLQYLGRLGIRILVE